MLFIDVTIYSSPVPSMPVMATLVIDLWVSLL